MSDHLTHVPPIRIIAVSIEGLLPCSLNHANQEASVTAIDSLMLEAKQAIMDEHHRRFQTLYQEGRWEEALRQIQVTLNCAADLLNESLRVLDETCDAATTSLPIVPVSPPQPRSE